jgi:putative transposase
LIDSESDKMTVKHQCELLGLARSTAYYEPKVRVVSKEEIYIKNQIDQIHFREPSYGVRRIRVELEKRGYQLSQRKIRRYMLEMCIEAFYPGPNLSKRDLASRTYPYLLRNVRIERNNQVWGIDITYCGTPTGFVYLVAIIDWHSRFLVGWSISNTITTDFVVRAKQ